MNKSMITSNQKKILFLILALSFVIRFIFTLTIDTTLKSDSITYHKLALSILSGEYSLDGRHTAFVVCGYPVFLSSVYFLFGEGQFFVKVIQSLLEIFTGYLFFRVSMNFFSTKYSLVSTAVYMFFPSNMLFSQAILTETLFGFFAMIVLYFCLGKNITKNVFVTGMFFGLAILVRSSFSFAALLVPLFLIFRRRDLFGNGGFFNPLKCSAYFAAGMLLILSPWLIRNKIVMNSFTLATQGGSTLWEGNNPQATGTWNSEAVNSNSLFDNPDEILREKEFYSQAIDYIRSNPVKFVTNGVKKLGYLFSSERMAVLYFTDSEPGESSTVVYKRVNPLILATVNIPYFAIMLLGTWGLLALKENRFFIYGFIIVWMITIFIFVGLARYHYVLIPFFVLGTVNVFAAKNIFRVISPFRKAIGILFTIFLIAVWSAEAYLMFK